MNFIIYEDEKEYVTKYKNVIYKIIGPTILNFNIIEFNEYNSTTQKELDAIEGNKIYILDIEVPGKNGLELARNIRQNGDWTSPIIIVTSHDEFKTVGYTGKILMLNFISKDGKLESDLYETLELALKINMTKKSLCYTHKGEMFHIPHQDILYVEKSLNDNNCNIVTKNKTYCIRKSIRELEKILCEEVHFIKTHRSCIVNLNHVESVDFENNIISFVNKKIDLLSRNHKKKLKERMKEL